jgi:hypothetical protein
MTDSKLKDTNNIRISQSTQNPDNSVIWTPFNYRSAQAAIKAAIAENRAGVEDAAAKRKVGGFVIGKDGNDGFWFVKGMTDAQKASVTAAAADDVALGAEGRKAREAALKAERDAGKETEAKAPKAAKEQKSPEQVEADKAARAEAGRARAAERDASRVAIDAGSVNVGDTVEKDGVQHEVLHIGSNFDLNGRALAYAYFGDLGAEMAAKAAAKDAEAEADAPSM